jgi:hypothetical protein
MNQAAGESRARAGSGWDKLLEIEDRIFTEWRIRLYSSTMIIAWLFCALYILYRFRDIAGPASNKSRNDFSWMWVSRHVAQSIDPASVYDSFVFAATRTELVGPNDCGFGANHFVYPQFTYSLLILSAWSPTLSPGARGCSERCSSIWRPDTRLSPARLRSSQPSPSHHSSSSITQCPHTMAF